MKKMTLCFAILATITFFGGTMANACTPDTCGPGVTKIWSDWFDPGDDILFREEVRDDYEYIHDITHSGFEPETDTIEYFSLWVFFQDDCDGNEEKAKITIDGTTESWKYKLSWPYVKIINFEGDLTLNESGLLTVDINRMKGDFYFKKSKLIAIGCDYTRVPEPTTMLLLGLGLVGLAGVRRKFTH